MEDNQTRGETHGCIVCGKLHQLYVVYDAQGKFINLKVMSGDGKRVENSSHALVACEKHTEEEIKAAVRRVFDPNPEDDD